MKSSSFQFSNPKLLSLNYSICADHPQNDEYGITLKSPEVSIKRSKTDTNQAVVELALKIEGAEQPGPFTISITMGAAFKWDSDAAYSEEDIEKLLKINAPALLLAYCRPVIANITGMSPFPPFHLPFINFMD